MTPTGIQRRDSCHFARALLPVVLLMLTALVACGQSLNTVTGADLLVTKYAPLIKGKRLALVVNHTSLLSDGRYLAKAILDDSLATLVSLFSPEHGLRGDADDLVEDFVDSSTGLPVRSLYGRNRKPSPESLTGVDLLVFDLQDVGTRFYTYATTLGLVMESAAENGKPIIVLDRPNPVAPMAPDGPILEDSLRSFVGFARTPILHGMTLGELSKFYNGEGCLAGNLRASLTVVAMENWTHSTFFWECGLRWVSPSPNMPSPETVLVYPGMCLVEGTNLSEGRGTEKPFEYAGAPWLNSARVIELLEEAGLPGVQFEAVQFIPAKRGASVKFSNQGCNGVYVRVSDPRLYEPVRTGIAFLWAVKTAHPDRLQWRIPTIDRLCGTRVVREMIDAGEKPRKIYSLWRAGLQRFQETRKKYLMYE